MKFLIILIFIVIIIIIYYIIYIKNFNIKQNISLNQLYKNNNIVDIFKNISIKFKLYPALRKKIKNKLVTITYNEYYNFSYIISKKLLYITPNPRVGILSYNRFELFYIYMGALMAHGIPIIIHPLSIIQCCLYIINNSYIEILIIENMKQLSKFYNIKIPTIKIIIILENINDNNLYDETIDNDETNNDDNNISKELIENIKKNNIQIKIILYDIFMKKNINKNLTIELNKIQQNNICTLIYSENNINPKGAIITHKNMIYNIKYIIGTIESISNIIISTKEKFISNISLNCIESQLMNIFIPIVITGIVYIINKEELKNPNNYIKEIKPTIFLGNNKIFKKIIKKMKKKKDVLINELFFNKIIIKENGFENIKYFINLDYNKKINNFFNIFGIDICHFYGMNKIYGPISISIPGKTKGYGIPVVKIKFDEKTSEILVKGKNTFKGYYKNNFETNKIFNESKWIKTGDIGYINRSGILFLTGKKKDLLITINESCILPKAIEKKLIKKINKNKKIINFLVLIGNKKKYISVLIFTTKKNILNDYIKKCINKINKNLNNEILIKKFTIIVIKKNKINNFFTRKLNIKRKKINKKYNKLINKIYKN